ncbi:MAG: DUF1343 domain-containing protein [Phycisphaeraceae bacterium]
MNNGRSWLSQSATALLVLCVFAGAATTGLAGDEKNPHVLVGIDVLVEHDYEHLAEGRVGLITNHTGLDRKGRRTIDLLHEAEGVDLVALFSPEHGLLGELDEKVGHAKDEKTGLRVWSLYGETRRPTFEMLENIDTLVFDVQDIGARFYTYIATMGYAMEQAAEHDIRFVVLDRPNPITGKRVAGPLADADDLAFIAYQPIPIVHGMTVGELAMLFRMRFDVECDLVVVPMRGWRREMWWDQTGRDWVNPSPNMPSPTSALLYPGVALLEFSNVSVGRGTDQAFQIMGAPWIDGEALAQALNAREMAGLKFEAHTFTPAASRFADEPCHGIRISVTDREQVDAVRLGLTLAWELNHRHGETFESDRVRTLLRNADTHQAWQKTDDPATLDATWEADLQAFRKMRQEHLIYE